MALPIPPVHFSPAEYLELERAAEFKSEYLDGLIYAMSGASPRFSTIAVNLTREISAQLKGSRCQAFSSDTKVRTQTDNFYAYPDLSVVCGEPVFQDPLGYILDNPTLIVEILSPSTEGFDRGKKFARYREINALRNYVLIEQDLPKIELYVRQSDNTWVFSEVAGLESNLTLPAINCEISLREIYDRIEF
jgi:Uma2 family endonuclease